MADIFLRQDCEKLLYNKFVVIIGDSIQRAVYKDLVLLLQKNRYLTDGNLRNKGEMSFEGDELIEGGKKGKMTNGINYREVRQYVSDYNLIRFYFVCRSYNAYMESILADLKEEPRPDVVILNSCLWDISRYGVTAIDEYKENLKTLFRRFKEVLPADCLVIWNTTLPISRNARGGFLVPEIESMNSTLQNDIIEANYYAAKVVVENEFDVLDLHFYLQHHLHRQADDGVHWDMTAHRRMTNLLLTHIADAWQFPLPGNVKPNRNEVQQDFRFGNIQRGPFIEQAPVIPQTTMTPNHNELQHDTRFGNIIQSGSFIEQAPVIPQTTVNWNQNQGSDPYVENMPHQCLNNRNMLQQMNMQKHASTFLFGNQMNNANEVNNYNNNANFQWQPYSNTNYAAMMIDAARQLVMYRNRYQPYRGQQQRRRARR